jgi:hypothetical protein
MSDRPASDDEFAHDDEPFEERWADDESFLEFSADWPDDPSEDDDGPDDDGLGGVREPRRPRPGPSADAVELPEPGAEGSSGL